MKTTKLTSEQLEQMSYTDVAFLVLKETGKKMNIQDLFKKVIELMNLPENYFESKIADFFGLLSTDKNFVMLEKGFWDLRDNHKSNVVITDEDEEEEEIIDEAEEIIDEEEAEEINYDDEDTVDDDDEEDQFKDLVIMGDDEAEEM